MRKIEIDKMYIDLEKASDSLTHENLENLLFMLAWGGGGNLSCSSNFLTGRFTNVKVGNARSEYATLGSGVPQGSIHGPLLLILFNTNVFAGLSNLQNQLYADDSKLYNRADSIQHQLLRMTYPRFTTGSHHGNFFEILHPDRNGIEYRYTVNDHLLPPKESCRDLRMCG